MKTVSDIRNIFLDKYNNEEFVTDKSGCKMLEVLGTSFIADEDTIFGKVNEEYIKI